MLDPASYVHPQRQPISDDMWRRLPHKLQNMMLFERYRLQSNFAFRSEHGLLMDLLLAHWLQLNSLCFLLGAFSQRANLLASNRYRRLDSACKRFLDLPFPNCVTPPALGLMDDLTAIGLTGLLRTLPKLPEALKQRLELIVAPTTSQQCDRTLTSHDVSPWIPPNLLLYAASYAKFSA